MSHIAELRYVQQIEFSKSLICQYSQVALQFPDELLVDSVAVAVEIERNSNAKPFILADTSYGR